MRVFTEQVTLGQIEACLIRMKGGPFTAFDVVEVARAQGVAHAEALIQRLIALHRKNLHQSTRRQWRWREADDPSPR